MLRLNSQYARNHLAGSPTQSSRQEPRLREEHCQGYQREQQYDPLPHKSTHTRGKTYNYDDVAYQPRSTEIVSTNEP